MNKLVTLTLSMVLLTVVWSGSSGGVRYSSSNDLLYMWQDKEQPKQCFDDEHFPKIHWGMSKEEIKIIEKDNIIIEGLSYLLCEGNIWGYDAKIQYSFEDDNLYKASCELSVAHSDVREYYFDIKNLVYLLSRKYGARNMGGIMVDSEFVLKYGIDFNPETLCNIDGTYYIAIWGASDTLITLFFSLENNKAMMSIDYDSNKYLDNIDK